MAPITWHSGPILVVPAQRSLYSLRIRILHSHPDWVLIHRMLGALEEPLLYPFRASELLRQADVAQLAREIGEVLGLREDHAAPTTAGRRPSDSEGLRRPHGGLPPSRFVHLNAEGRPTAVGEVLPAAAVEI